jgi:hypothetical protein
MHSETLVIYGRITSKIFLLDKTLSEDKKKSTTRKDMTVRSKVRDKRDELNEQNQTVNYSGMDLLPDVVVVVILIPSLVIFSSSSPADGVYLYQLYSRIFLMDINVSNSR